MIKQVSKRSSKQTASVILGRLLSAGFELIAALYKVLLELFASVEIGHAEDRRLHDSDLPRDLNHRTGRLDAGTDPHYWYDN